MRYFITFLALAGFVVSTGCTNTATGFGKDLEKSGQTIQKTVGGKTASSNNAGSNAQYQPSPSTYSTQYDSPESVGAGYDANAGAASPTPSGY